MSNKSDKFGIINTALNVTNLGLNWYSDRKLNRTMKNQNIGGVVLLLSAIGVSLSNTLWIIKANKQHIEGANNNGNLRALGSSGNNRDSSQHHRNHL